MIGDGFTEIITAPPGDRLNLFLSTAQRLGTPVQNIEKDFWVCWTLYALYHRLPTGSPRLLFRGETSLSKAYGLIRRFSEDIDVTVFRDDLGESARRKAERKKQADEGESASDGLHSNQVTVLGRPELDFLRAEARTISGLVRNQKAPLRLSRNISAVNG